MRDSNITILDCRTQSGIAVNSYGPFILGQILSGTYGPIPSHVFIRVTNVFNNPDTVYPDANNEPIIVYMHGSIIGSVPPGVHDDFCIPLYKDGKLITASSVSLNFEFGLGNGTQTVGFCTYVK